MESLNSSGNGEFYLKFTLKSKKKYRNTVHRRTKHNKASFKMST